MVLKTELGESTDRSAVAAFYLTHSLQRRVFYTTVCIVDEGLGGHRQSTEGLEGNRSQEPLSSVWQ